MSQLLTPGPVSVFLPRFPRDGGGPCRGGAKRWAGGASGSTTSTRALSDCEPVGLGREVTRLYAGRNGAPVLMRVTPENSQLSANQCTGRNCTVLEGFGRFQ